MFRSIVATRCSARASGGRREGARVRASGVALGPSVRVGAWGGGVGTGRPSCRPFARGRTRRRLVGGWYAPVRPGPIGTEFCRHACSDPLFPHPARACVGREEGGSAGESERRGARAVRSGWRVGGGGGGLPLVPSVRSRPHAAEVGGRVVAVGSRWNDRVPVEQTPASSRRRCPEGPRGYLLLEARSRVDDRYLVVVAKVMVVGLVVGSSG